jgi:HEAT repeat protein
MRRTLTLAAGVALLAGCATGLAVDRPAEKDVEDARTVKQLMAGFSADDPVTRLAAAREVAKKGKPAVPEMIKALKDSDWRVRRTATDALAGIGADAADAVEALTKALADEKMWVRAGAAMALGRIGEPARPAIGKLVELASDPDDFLREDVMTALNALCRKPEDQKPLLKAAVAASMHPDTGAMVRRHTTKIIEKHMRTDPEAKKAAIYILNHPAQGMWAGFSCKAAEILVEMGEPGTAIPPVIKLLDSDSKGFRALAARTLGKFGKLAKKALPKLEKLAKDDRDKNVRKAAAEAAEKIRSGAEPEVGKPKAKGRKKNK